LEIFASVFDVPGVDFYCFNRDLKAGDAEILPHYKITNLIAKLTDFAEASKLIGQMDLVITCDTATAHLAGGMGKKVWVMLPFAPDWRWLTGRTDSPWYPTMRLFRQPVAGDWASVVDEVKKALTGLLP
jgi:ADP-heptose:LPS heptosyltransferase